MRKIFQDDTQLPTTQDKNSINAIHKENDQENDISGTFVYRNLKLVVKFKSQ